MSGVDVRSQRTEFGGRRSEGQSEVRDQVSAVRLATPTAFLSISWEVLHPFSEGSKPPSIL